MKLFDASTFKNKRKLLGNSSGLDGIDIGGFKSLPHIPVFLQITLHEGEVLDIERRLMVLSEDVHIKVDPKPLVLGEQRDTACHLGDLNGNGDPSTKISHEIASLDCWE